MRWFALLFSGFCLSLSLAGEPDAGDSLRQRVEEIQNLLERASDQLQGLNNALQQDFSPVLAEPDSQPLATLLLTPRQKKLYRASAGQLKQIGLGFGFNNQVGEALSSNFIYWWDTWGWRLEAAARFEESGPKYAAMGGVYLLRSLHSFSLMEIPNLFHFFALGGARFVFQTEEYEEMRTSESGGYYFTGKEKLYDESDINADLILGVSSEIFIPLFSGLRLAPEIGYKASYFFSRHQDSPEWPSPAEEDMDKPGSDFSLEWHVAFNFYFYFK